jgi:alkanesulfonate monooxygenase SsuD/methylene tetrahydromethanopterin reductase-like flavin-dependent oxidoreductase (luciferase family)
MTGGRFILGVGLGDAATEFATFRVPAKQRGKRFEEQVAIIRALWAGATTNYKGRFYEFEGAQLGTLPLSAGGPPIWIGGWGPRQIERAARIGDAWLPGPVAKLAEVAQRREAYEKALDNLGREQSRRPRPIIRDVIVAPRESEAWALALDHVLAPYAETYAQDASFLSGGGAASKRAVEFARERLSGLAHDRLIIGSPSTVAAEIERCIHMLDADHVIFRLKLPGLTPEQITQMLYLLGEDVLPKLRQMTSTRLPASGEQDR